MHGRAGAGPPAPASLGARKIVCNRPDDGKDRIKGGENPKAVMKDLKTNYYFVHFRNSEHLLSAMNLPIGSPFATPTNQRLISYSQTDQNTDDGEQENLENEKRIHNERLRLNTEERIINERRLLKRQEEDQRYRDRSTRPQRKKPLNKNNNNNTEAPLHPPVFPRQSPPPPPILRKKKKNSPARGKNKLEVVVVVVWYNIEGQTKGSGGMSRKTIF